MRITSDIPEHAACAEAILLGFVACARLMIRAGAVPAFPPRDGSVRYQLEPPGEEDWKLPHRVLSDTWGDCEDIALWECAGLQETGADPGAVVRIIRTSREKLHAAVQLSDGSIHDACIELMTPEDRRKYTDAD